MKDSVIIVSGGMDSITLLHEKAEEIALAVTFDYGSNHNKREAECAARHCQQLGIEHIIIPLAFIGQYSSPRFWRARTPCRRAIMRPKT